MWLASGTSPGALVESPGEGTWTAWPLLCPAGIPSYSSAAWSRDQTRVLGRERGGEVDGPGPGRPSGSVGCGAWRWKSSGAVAQPDALCCSPGCWLCSVSLAAVGRGEASVPSVPVSEPWPSVAASGR